MTKTTKDVTKEIKKILYEEKDDGDLVYSEGYTKTTKKLLSLILNTSKEANTKGFVEGLLKNPNRKQIRKEIDESVEEALKSVVEGLKKEYKGQESQVQDAIDFIKKYEFK